MKRSRLPFTALRAFEAAGRHQSFKRAAEELAVSEAAISRQIRDLEGQLSIALFERGHRNVRLTSSGARLLGELTESFEAIDAALSDLIAPPHKRKIFVSVEPTFATLFLIPRLAEFTTARPDIDVQIESSSSLVDLGDDDAGLAVRYSLIDKSWPRTEARHLIDNVLTPMIAAVPLGVEIKNPSDIAKVRLLRDEDETPWQRWLAAAGVQARPTWGPVFSNAGIALQSAQLGHGAALADRHLADRLLKDNQLRAPFDLDINNGAYWLVARDFAKLTASERTFCDWLIEALNTSAG
ncbi:MAG: LysR family transcriptional regulator [Mesorhizobium sp.]|nr:MAG: LysR family transcriptional regulator [Mesorhizobium sp.]